MKQQHYEAATHRSVDNKIEEVQQGNAQWWTEHTMSYDWGEQLSYEKFSSEWFDEIDRRFVYDSRLYGHDKEPFDRMIPFEQLKGKRVLEIGCGMGFHTELLVKSGAQVESIDISETSVNATKARLKLKGLEAKVIQQDAEILPFEDESFDFVWTWGVIHHSSRTAKIVREVARVLKSDGRCAVMVYNREGASAWRALIKYQWLRFGFFRGRSADEALNLGTDGFHARHYTTDQFEDLFRGFFQEVSSYVCGQVPDSLPLPRALRRMVRPLFSESWLKKKQATRGSFIFLTAESPT